MPDESEPPSGTAPSVLDRENAQRAVESGAALSRYRRQMRRQRAIYYPVVGTVVLGLVIAFVVAYLHGEAHNVRLQTLKTAADQPAGLAVRTPSAVQRKRWHTSDRVAIGNARYRGTVVMWGGRTMRGVDARTGKQTWSYYRSDRTICSAAQIGGIAVATYELAGNCDELTALDAGTGQREWTRTLDFDGQPLFGRPTFQADASDGTLMITSPGVIYSIAVGKSLYNNGENRFIYSHFGCRINGAVLGSQGALISQTCSDPRCGTQKFCGKGPQLLLRGDPTQDVVSNSNNSYDGDPKNLNRIVWNNFGDTDVPVSAGEVIAAGNRTTGELDVLSNDKGKPAGSLDLGVGGSAWSGDVSASDLGDGDLLVDAGGQASVVGDGVSKPLWSVESQGLASASGTTVAVPTANGVQVLARSTGSVQDTYPLTPTAPPGGTVYRLGSGFLITSGSGTTAYS